MEGSHNQIAALTVGKCQGVLPWIKVHLIAIECSQHDFSRGIQINAVNRVNLEALNGGTTVTEDPAAADPESTTTSVDYSISTPVTEPPQ